MIIIYLHTCIVSGMGYVGQTCNTMERRWRQHAVSPTTFGCAIRMYGPECWLHSILQSCSTQEEANDAESRWIHDLVTLSPNGYNWHFGHGLQRELEGCVARRVYMESLARLPTIERTV